MMAAVCQCGCGQSVGVAKQTRVSKGHVKGQPLRYLNGHGHPGRRRETCRQCGTGFFPKSRKKGRQPQFCSIQCWAAYTPTTKCVRCRIEIVPKGWAKRCVSCRSDLYRAHNRRHEFQRRLLAAFERLAGTECPRCHRRFIPRSGERRRKFCSEQCSHRFHVHRHGDRRRSLLAGEVIDPATTCLDYIGERDNWRCHICSGHVHRKDATRDHLIPVIHGGLTTAENLALAHRRCNTRRLDGRIPAQLRLVG
jgi:hypothetical protein